MTLYLIYCYVFVALVTMTWLLHFYRNEPDYEKDGGDGPAAMAAIVIGVFWLPLMLVFFCLLVYGGLRS